jgi:LacI family transcriptional regulator
MVLGGPRITLGAAEAVGELGLRVPAELSLVGFGHRAWMRWWGPGLTTVALPARDLALACGQHLTALLRTAPRAASAAMQSPLLLRRGSTARLR